MGRPPSNGNPAFRFTQNEVSEMEGILDEHNLAVPPRRVLISIAEKFSNSADRIGKVAVQVKQVWNWFQNRRYALRAKFNKASGPAKLSVSTMPREDPIPTRNLTSTMPAPAPSIMSTGRNLMDNAHLDFEAKSVRDGAWYDVLAFLSHRYYETGDPEVLVRFAGFGPGEDEWVNVRRHIRQRSLPCESSECVVVLPGDLVLCFQEGKEQALYFDAHVVDAQRWRHDIRGCRCRFLVRYDHDQFEEVVPLRKVCRRPETDYRLQQLQAAFKESAALDQQETFSNPPKASTIKALGSTEMMHEEHKALENSSPESMLAPLPDVEIQDAETRSADNVGTSEVRLSSAEITNATAKSSALTPGSGDIVTEGNPSPLIC